MCTEKHSATRVAYARLLLLKISYGTFMPIISRMCGSILISISAKYHYLCLKIVADKN